MSVLITINQLLIWSLARVEKTQKLYNISRGMHVLTGDVRASSRDRYESLLASVYKLHDVVDKFKAADVDPTEFACLKGIVIFKTS